MYGLRVLKGKERRELQNKIAADRAAFELEYDGMSIVPFDYEQIASAARQIAKFQVYVSPAFVKQTQARVSYWRRSFEEFEPELKGSAKRRLNG